MQNPFVITFSKAPEYTYIAADSIGEILDNFSYDAPSESVYKVIGVRGSGKTVILAKVEEELRNRNDWIVIDINPTRDILMQIAAYLIKDGYGKSGVSMKSKALSVNIAGFGAEYATERKTAVQDIGVELDQIFEKVAKKNKKVLLGIDEVSKTNEMIVFASEFGRWLRANYPVYLVCTGLYENIQELSNVKNLTFFRRATTVKTEPLNTIRMSEMYKNKLSISGELAREMAKATKGYAYAFQVLGLIAFKKKDHDTFEELLPEFKAELFAYSYEKIWEEMTDNDRFLAKLLIDKDEYKREEVLQLMDEKAANYSVYRDRLLKRGILSTTRQGYISFALPFFGDYIREYC